MEFDWKYALNKLMVMVTSRKFLVCLFAALATSGLDIPAEWQALIYVVVAGMYAGTQAYEDAAGYVVIDGLPKSDD